MWCEIFLGILLFIDRALNKDLKWTGFGFTTLQFGFLNIFNCNKLIDPKVFNISMYAYCIFCLVIKKIHF